MSPPFTGRHVLAELSGAAPEALEDEPGLRTAFGAALADAGATVLQILTHRFTPHGLTLVAVLTQSHASLHTWPERGAAFADVFTCGPTADPERAVAGLAQRLGAHLRMYTVQRGTAAPVREPIGPGLTRLWDVEQVLWEGQTAYQHVLIARTSHGATLFCDDERQSSQATQLVYHEALLVPALALAERLDRVLVIGSGEGVASQVAVAAGAQRVDHVDIDIECVRRCAALLPYGYTPDELRRAETGDGPVRVHYRDGQAFLDTTTSRYDVIVLDLPDERPNHPEAQHNRLYTTDLLRRVAAALTPGGVVASQAGCPTLWRNTTLRRSLTRFTEVFPSVVHYGSDEHEWSFLLGTPQPVPEPVERLIHRLGTLPYHSRTLDTPALRRGAVLPHALRHLPPADPQ